MNNRAGAAKKASCIRSPLRSSASVVFYEASGVNHQFDCRTRSPEEVFSPKGIYIVMDGQKVREIRDFFYYLENVTRVFRIQGRRWITMVRSLEIQVNLNFLQAEMQ